jgi:hypothetical protein
MPIECENGRQKLHGTGEPSTRYHGSTTDGTGKSASLGDRPMHEAEAVYGQVASKIVPPAEARFMIRAPLSASSVYHDRSH